jgi:murein L,D-transpeptidase YcbB/YkuD
MTKNITPESEPEDVEVFDLNDIPDFIREDEVAPVEEVEPVAPKKVSKHLTPPPSDPHVLGDGATDSVVLSAIIYKNVYSHRSTSVYHVQRRLGEWGYPGGEMDEQGYYGDPTKSAVEDFQNDQGLEATGLMDAPTLEALFAGDENVTLTL